MLAACSAFAMVVAIAVSNRINSRKNGLECIEQIA